MAASADSHLESSLISSMLYWPLSEGVTWMADVLVSKADLDWAFEGWKGWKGLVRRATLASWERKSRRAPSWRPALESRRATKASFQEL